MSTLWTEDQKKVIHTKDKNLLVSAAAGSGKTAVLVARILHMVTDETRKIDVDRLLITTFTNAAAGEMKERIGKALREQLEQAPENEWLQRQEALVHRAQITTIHGFCLYVIRNYFHTIDLNPNFRIADEGEMKLLKQDVAEAVIEEAFASGSEEMRCFAECYGSGNKGGGLEDLILQLYEYAIANPQPERWLSSCVKAYELPKDACWADFVGAEAILADLKMSTEECLIMIQEARTIAALPGGPLPYDEALLDDQLILQELLSCKSVEAFERQLREIVWKRLASKSSKAMAGVDEELRSQVAGMRDTVKKIVEGFKKNYFKIPSSVLLSQMQEMGQNIKTYVELTLRFMECLTEKKRQKNILDFSDQEHLALKILTKEVDGELVPSEVADVFADYFAEIMVDEYQDSNRVQEAILDSISGSRKGRDNRFMVGDVKQSIYHFRQAEPGMFLSKYEQYATGEAGVRIDLHKNFRSREQVIQSVNEVFEKIMQPSLGGIAYDEGAALYAGASYPENEKCESELLLIREEEWEALREECRWTKIEAEAHVIAERIRQLLKDGLVTEKGELRKVRPGDIVILLRTMSGWSETFVRVLQEEGIRASAQSRTGYFETLEVETLLAYLRVLDNPTQEIPLAAAMHGLLGGFSSEDMARIKAAYPKLGFAAACRQYGIDGPEGKLRQKVADFFAQIESYREQAAYTSIHELLWQLITKSGYMDQVGALPGGEQRLANVEMLLQKAKDYEKISFHGLFHFVRYIEKLQKYRIDYGEADVAGENPEAVQIMSIHHSKGLEFPIVFAAGLGKEFNRQSDREKMVLNRIYGIGAEYVDLEKRMHCPTILKHVIRRQNRMEQLAEELRVLYVAMTRAKEKLIMTGMVKEELAQSEGANRQGHLLFSELFRADCMLTWILLARRSFESSMQKEILSMEQILKTAVERQIKKELSREELEKLRMFGSVDETLYAQIDERLSWKYPWNIETGTKQKYSVTELKKLRMLEASDSSEELYAEGDVIPLIPQFIEETTEKTGAARGTVYHTIMEWMDFAHVTTLAQVEEKLEELQSAGKLTKQDIDAVRPQDFLTFAVSDLSGRMQQAKEKGALYREQPFVIGLPGNEVDGSGEDETVLIQGIIDAFFYEEDEIVVLDYKTDQVFNEKKLADKYRAQLGYYEKALEMMTGKRVKERLIYSFTLGKVIKV